MAVVKLKEKKKLDQLIAKITLRLGSRPTQQDVLDICVGLGDVHIDEIIEKISPSPVFTDEKLASIIKMRESLSKIEWLDDDEINDSVSQDDKDIYLS